MTVNEELDPELVIQRLKAEVEGLKAEIRHACPQIMPPRTRTCKELTRQTHPPSVLKDATG